MGSKARRLIAFGALALASTAAPAAGAATPFDGVHAHRGGPNPGGQPTYPENSMAAFRAARAQGADVIELDPRLTADDVPVVMHDATLDRTTNCTGPLGEITAAELARRCRVDTVGTGGKLEPAVPPGVPVPTLAEVLAWAKAEGAALNLHVKNSPAEGGYDPTPELAQTMFGVVDASGIDKRRVLVQSFWAPNIDAARERGFPTSLLRSRPLATLRTVGVARKNDYGFVSPGWPTARNPRQFVTAARAAGRGVVPYGINSATSMRRAIDAGVNGFITNDVVLAMRPKQRPPCRRAYVGESRTRAAYKRRLRVYRSARRAAPRRARKLRRRAFSARRGYLRARQARRVTCAKFR